MSGNIFVIESESLNKLLITSIKNESTEKDITDSQFPETFSFETTDEKLDSNFLLNFENGEIVIESNDAQESLEAEDDSEEPSVFVPCMEDGRVVMRLVRESFARSIDCEESVTEVDSKDRSELTLLAVELSDPSETVTTKEEKLAIDLTPGSHPTVSSIPFRVSSPLPEFDDGTILKYLKPQENVQNGIFKRFSLSKKYYSKSKRSIDYSDERFMIYSPRKRRLKFCGKVDKVTTIPPKLFKKQLMDASDTTEPLLLMPSTNKGMEVLRWTVNKAFTEPTSATCSRLSGYFYRNCKTKHQPDEQDVSEFGLMPVGFQTPIDKTKIKRITRKRRNPADNYQKIIKHLATEATPSSKIEYFIQNRHDIPETATSEIHERVRVFLPTEGEGCFLYSGDGDEDEDDSQQIIVIHDEQEDVEDTAYSQSGMEALLAAAEGHPSHPNVFFCQRSAQTEVIVTSDSELLEPKPIIFMSDTYSETDGDAGNMKTASF